VTISMYRSLSVDIRQFRGEIARIWLLGPIWGPALLPLPSVPQRNPQTTRRSTQMEVDSVPLWPRWRPSLPVMQITKFAYDNSFKTPVVLTHP